MCQGEMMIGVCLRTCLSTVISRNKSRDRSCETGEVAEATTPTLHEVALEEKCTTDGLPIYLNITLESTLAKDIYGVNYDKFKVIRNTYDPKNAMGQAAGFII